MSPLQREKQECSLAQASRSQRVTGREHRPHSRDGSDLPEDDVQVETFGEEKAQGPASQERAEDASGLTLSSAPLGFVLQQACHVVPHSCL